MRGAIPPLPQYVFMAWFLVKHTNNLSPALQEEHRLVVYENRVLRGISVHMQAE
jgi:hypothetical protein